MLLAPGTFSTCNFAIAGNCESHLFSNFIRRPTGKAAAVNFHSPTRFRTVKLSVATGKGKGEPQELSYEPTIGNWPQLGSMASDGLSYREKFQVRCYEVGMNKTASIETIARLLQEVAANHGRSVGMSNDGIFTTRTMRKFGLIWVITRLQIEMYKYPERGDVIEIETASKIESKLFLRCDWLLKDFATTQVIGRCTSTSVMINQDTRRLQIITDDIHDEYEKHCSRMRLVFPEDNNASLKKIPRLEEPYQHSKLRLLPRQADLDMNMHVNNATHITLVMESMPQEIIESHELHSITLDFRRECKQEDVVDSFTSPGSTPDFTLLEAKGTNGSQPVAEKGENDDYLHFLHLLRFSKDGSEINRSRTTWRKKPAKN